MTTHNLVKCPYCNVFFSEEESQIVCTDCTKRYKLDLDIADLTKTICNLSDTNTDLLKTRKRLLLTLKGTLDEILQRIV